jgi:hypothetical protein
VVAGLALGAAVALLGWLLLAKPLTALTRWLRTVPGLRAVFADHTERLASDSRHLDPVTAARP